MIANQTKLKFLSVSFFLSPFVMNKLLEKLYWDVLGALNFTIHVLKTRATKDCPIERVEFVAFTVLHLLLFSSMFRK